MPDLRKGKAYFWITGIAKAIVGEEACLLQPWLKAHFQIEKRPSDFNMAKWKMDHAAMVSAECDKLRRDEWTVKVEDQNWFRLTGDTAILAGKPDIVATRKGVVRVVDAKSGQPTESDTAQVALYLIAIPMAWKRPGLLIGGELVYQKSRLHVSSQQADELKAKAFSMIRQLANIERKPLAVPSARGCAHCDVTQADCPDRIEVAEAEATTTEF